ncbi:unnamed protein product [Moneuplotes crassus]|uniref:Uncharacterized protein n=1 Tax=Euplotes crassus TaxID=5936 RepID=A0AAD2D0P9_EUPCR|nr:unnamed protein product [Moneuplotes crassus]
MATLSKHGHKNKHLMAALALIGLYKVATTTLSYSWSFFKTFLRPGRNLYKRYQGGYVVVTGATDGLGLEYARQFALKGFNLVLVARNQEKLDATKAELSREHQDIDIQLIQFDFNKPYTQEGYEPLKQAFDNIGDISVLVNNVGTAEFKMLDDQDLEPMNRMIQVNCIPQVIVTKFLLPRLLARSKEQNKRTAIISVSSVLDYVPLPTTAVYTATKSFNKTFSDVLRKEYGEHIDVMTILPGPTKTNLMKREGGLIATASQHARWSLSDVGYNSESFGHYKHCIFRSIFKMPLVERMIISSMLKAQKEQEQ